MTIFEQIKDMSIDEMAKLIFDEGFFVETICRKQKKCPYAMDNGDISDDCDCTDCVKKWLESEVKGQ